MPSPILNFCDTLPAACTFWNLWVSPKLLVEAHWTCLVSSTTGGTATQLAPVKQGLNNSKTRPYTGVRLKTMVFCLSGAPGRNFNAPCFHAPASCIPIKCEVWGVELTLFSILQSMTTSFSSLCFVICIQICTPQCNGHLLGMQPQPLAVYSQQYQLRSSSEYLVLIMSPYPVYQ